MKVKLRALDHRNNTVSTRWGDVTFDGDGLAELEVPEDEVEMLRNFRPYSWLASDHEAARAAGEARNAAQDVTAAPETTSDTSDVKHVPDDDETPAQGTEKATGKKKSK